MSKMYHLAAEWRVLVDVCLCVRALAVKHSAVFHNIQPFSRLLQLFMFFFSFCSAHDIGEDKSDREIGKYRIENIASNIH